MPPRSDFQNEFAGSLLDGAGEVPIGLTSVTQDVPAERFNIYRNNVHVSLIDSLVAKYPAVFKIVGEDFFRGLARTYIRTHPPRSPVIIRYGGGFADFLAGFEHVQDLPYLADVARLEWLRLEAYHEADARSFGAEELAKLDHGRLGETIFEFHPSIRLLKSAYPVVTIWQTNIEGGDPSEVDMGGEGESLMIIRPQFDVKIMTLSSTACDFVQALCSGKSLEVANVEAAGRGDAFDLQLVLSGLIQCGAFTGFST